MKRWRSDSFDLDTAVADGAEGADALFQSLPTLSPVLPPLALRLAPYSGSQIVPPFAPYSDLVERDDAVFDALPLLFEPQKQQKQKQAPIVPSRRSLLNVGHLVAGCFPHDTALMLRSASSFLARDERVVAAAANAAIYENLETGISHTLLSAVCGHGNLRRVQALLQNPLVKLHAEHNAALKAAANNETGASVQIVRFLFEDQRFDLKRVDEMDWAHAAKLAACTNNAETLELLLPFVSRGARVEALVQAARRDHVRVVQLLYQGVTEDEGNLAILEAARAGAATSVSTLLQPDSPVGPGGATHALIAVAGRAASDFSLPLFAKLLRDARTDPAANDNSALRSACKRGTAAAISNLLANPRVRQSLMNVQPEGLTLEGALSFAVASGNHAAVAVILALSYTFIESSQPLLSEPALSRALLQAADDEDTELVRLLLKDRRADPNANFGDGTALESALSYGDDNLAREIISDRRTVPTLNALLLAVRHGCTIVLALMLNRKKFQRIDLKCALLQLLHPLSSGNKDATTMDQVCGVLLEAGTPCDNEVVQYAKRLKNASVLAMVLSARLERESKRGNNTRIAKCLADARLNLQLFGYDASSFRHVYQFRSFLRAGRAAKTAESASAFMWELMKQRFRAENTHALHSKDPKTENVSKPSQNAKMQA